MPCKNGVFLKYQLHSLVIANPSRSLDYTASNAIKMFLQQTVCVRSGGVNQRTKRFLCHTAYGTPPFHTPSTTPAHNYVQKKAKLHHSLSHTSTECSVVCVLPADERVCVYALEIAAVRKKKGIRLISTFSWFTRTEPINRLKNIGRDCRHAANRPLV